MGYKVIRYLFSMLSPFCKRSRVTVLSPEMCDNIKRTFLGAWPISGQYVNSGSGVSDQGHS